MDAKTQHYKEKYRPQFHFTPKENWMNDPNGMVFYKGEYHLFYQYHPFGTKWGPMHWGHAISRDLVQWEHQDIALAPDEHGMIFSGSAVVDWNDTSGFFNGKSGLVAVFTHADTYPGSDRPRQRQSLAYSLDEGRTWIKYKENPVLVDEGITDFRDPKVIWHHSTSKWIMVLAAGQSIHIYSSPNLKDWSFESAFGEGEGAHYGVWECPDLFELEAGEEKKWVMLVSLGDHPDVPYGSRTQYFIGEFDGKAFVSEADGADVRWLDEGKDNYAGVSWSDVESNRRIYIGWMSNWRYANDIPTQPWRSSMTLPRELVLERVCGEYKLFQKPIANLEGLREELFSLQDSLHIPAEYPLAGIHGASLEIVAEFEYEDHAEFGLKVRKSAEEETVIGYDAGRQELFIDRSRSGVSDFSSSFASRDAGRIVSGNNRLKLQLFVDASSVEVFANDGELAMTSLIFPDPGSDALELYSAGGKAVLLSLKIYTVNSIW